MRHVFISWALTLVHAGVCSTAPVSEFKEESIHEHPNGAASNSLTLATEFLQRFYNLEEGPSNRSKRSSVSFASKVREMQAFFGLNVTGALDSQTIKIMKTPRCGLPDVQNYSPHGQVTRWKKNILTYSIGRYTEDLPTDTVDSLITSALRVWSVVSPLIFLRSDSGNADIMIEFGTYEHGDSFPFDGPQGTLAHAFGPGEGIGGDTHFDDDEKWTDGSEGFNLFLVAAHEFGHALGLRHSRLPESLMYPTYKIRNPANLLSSEDIRQLQALYGPKRRIQMYYPRYDWSFFFSPRRHKSAFPIQVQDKCNPDMSFDAVANLGQDILFFKDRYTWIKHGQQPDLKERPINTFMSNTYSGIDAAYSVPKQSSLYLFKGSSYWTVKLSQMKSRPQPISKLGFPKQLRKIDAAVHLSKTGNTLFFANDKYWSYNETTRAMEDFYPRNIIDDFPGINTKINATSEIEGFIYFFCGREVHKYDNIKKQVVQSVKAISWLGC